MAVKINFNAEAAKTHTALIYNERLMGKSLLRLSTGVRILNASDDAAGLYIADMLGTVAAALEQGNANIQTGISALQIAESAAGQIYTKLQEIYVRIQRAANDINDPNARQALQQEIDNFVNAIEKIATDTEYNGIKLLDGTFTNKVIHYGPRAEQTITVNIDSLKPEDLEVTIENTNYSLTDVTTDGNAPVSGTNANPELALQIVEGIMKEVDSVRANIGAIMNNLQSVFDAQKVAYDNTKEAESVIRNTDYAKEMSEFVTYQIRMQATVAMLAQANTLPQLVLQLMR